MRRLLTVLAAGSLILAAAACGGDEDEGDENPGDAASSTHPKEQRKPNLKAATCTAEVSTSGSYEAEWRGKAKVHTGGKAADDPGPRAVYTLTHKKYRLSLYSPGADFKGSVSLSIGKTSYSSDPADAESFDIDETGKEAHVDVTLTSIEGETLDLVADFVCGKRKKKQ
jgi:hypothetical protein